MPNGKFSLPPSYIFYKKGAIHHLKSFGADGQFLCSIMPNQWSCAVFPPSDHQESREGGVNERCFKADESSSPIPCEEARTFGKF